MSTHREESLSEPGAVGGDKRIRQPTNKGLQWQLEVKEKKWKSCITSWRRSSTKLRALLTDEDAEVNAIKSHRDALQAITDDAVTAQEEFSTAAKMLSKEENSEAKLDELEEEHSVLMKQTYDRVRAAQGSLRLSTSSSSSKRRCQQWLDQQLQPNNTDDVQSDKVRQVRQENGVEKKVNADKPIPNEDLRPRQQQTFEEPANPVQELHQDPEFLTSCLIDQMRLNRLPIPEPPVFDGSPLQYPAWKRAYDMLIEKKEILPEDKFYYLLKYLKSRPFELVQGYSLLSNDHAYTIARQELDKRYGDTFVLSNAFRDKLDAWPKIGARDSDGLRRYGDFLRQCLAASQVVHHLNHLDDERENRKLLSKLPDWLTFRWGRKVVQWRRDTNSFPPFPVFVNFIVEEAEVASVSVMSVQEKKPSSKARTLSTGVQKKDEGSKKKFACLFCKGQHLLAECTSFASQPMEEKRKFVHKCNLCFGCLKPGHRSKECRYKSTCSRCKKRHPTALHDDNWSSKRQSKEDDSLHETEESHSSHASSNKSSSHTSKTSSIVPVWLSHTSTPRELLVYAMLDTQSDTTFIFRRTKEKMGVTGKEVNLLLSTMSKAEERVASEKIKGLKVRALNGEKEIMLPPSYTRDIMPANRTNEASEVGSVALLIGYDCPTALAPRAVIPPPVHGGPFAMQTDLGWSVIGMVDHDCKENDPIGISHRTMVKVLPEEVQLDGHPTEVLFSCQSTVREEIAPHQVVKLLEADFAPERSQRPYSQNDTKFLRLMEEQIRVTDDGHYETPLPFKETHPKLPNNRNMALKRLGSLKRKFEKDSEYHKLYTQKIRALIEKGYAEYVPNSSREADTFWYIPHHGVQQPNKLRVVFDCSAQCNGEALNHHLLTGPDLTNNLVGVLCRFRTDYVAFSCDIQEMFYQFQVRSDHRDYLRFLWWKDGDYRQPVCDLRMRVHLFGASSSPGCSNFCLKQIATDHEQQFGKDVKDFVHHDFYVDDGLKSVPTAEKATDLIVRTRELCEKGGAEWDDPLSADLQARWERWKNDIVKVESLSINRCFKPNNFGAIQRVELHHFSDASSIGYGQCTYLRLINEKGDVHCALVIGKSRVAPVKTPTIPRLELTAALLSVKASLFLKTELGLTIDKEVFWTDSRVVLGYVKNETRRFHVFVANRVKQIRDASSPSQWNYVETKDNPADQASRGIRVDQQEMTKWLIGPGFLWKDDVEDEMNEDESTILPNDPEVKRSHATIKHAEKFDLERLRRFSTWHQVKRAVANCLRLKLYLQRCRQEKQKDSHKAKIAIQPLSTELLVNAETEIIRHIQKDAFEDELRTLGGIEGATRKGRRLVKSKSRLHQLDPFIDTEGILRVGGRLTRVEGPFELKHPAILPQCHITELLVAHCHAEIAHQGRGMTINHVRAKGYWILGCSHFVSKFISRCVTCRKLRQPVQSQKMADLPKDRLTPSPPFTYCGVDCFGPWTIKEGRKELKRYGLIFTCMASRAIHIETLNSMTTDAFINGLRRFVSIRGPIRQLRSDRGTNFTGAATELSKAWKEMDQTKVASILLTEGCDYFDFKFNFPASSHMGGAWERQIRSVRTILDALLHRNGHQLDDDSLRTLLCEAAAIVNSRPLAVEFLNEPNHPEPLTPNHLLTQKTKVILPPPGRFLREDVYLKKRWRRVQHLCNEFWIRWKKEFLNQLQSRKKWTHTRRNMKVGDVVIIKDDQLPRNLWPLGRIVESYESEDNRVRKVKVAVGDRKLAASGKRTTSVNYLYRPIHKLVLLLSYEDQVDS
nr:uncharacterized protein LOC129283739 [Lytechinus pictus]